MDPASQSSRRTRAFLATVLVVFALSWSWLALQRFWTFHNETFDLAFYTRMAWGLAHWDFWDPILGTHILGLHLSPILGVLGLLGYVLPLSETLLVIQAFALAFAAWPLALIGERHLGRVGLWLGAFAFLLHPNVSHVATYEMHPGTLALLPLSWAVFAFDRRDAKMLLIATVGVGLCREDLCACTALLALLFWNGSGGNDRKLVLASFVLSCVPIALFLLVFHPQHAPDNGSFDLHFGHWQDLSLAHALDHFLTPRRLAIVPLVLAPLAMTSLLAWRYLLPSAPVFAIVLASAFPTATDIDVHYLTPAIPMVVAASMVALGSLPALASTIVLATTTLAYVTLGGGWLGGLHDANAFRQDARTRDARAIVNAIETNASVQAPYELMPHLAERQRIHRSPLPDRAASVVVLDVSHRSRFVHDESLLRTDEEPIIANWLARTDFRLTHHNAHYLMLERSDESDAPSRSGCEGTPTYRLTECLSLHAIERAGDDHVELVLHPHGPCPRDLVARLKSGGQIHTDLLMEGLASPTRFADGLDVRSRHAIEVVDGRVSVGLRRSSGARPSPGDPEVRLPLR